jgi:hypothetical protein
MTGKVLDRLAQLASAVEKSFPAIVSRGGELRIAREGRRLSWGYCMDKDQAAFVFRAVSENGTAVSWARDYIAENAENLRDNFGIDLRIEIVGAARAPMPNLSAGEYPATKQALEAVLRPGSSIGNEAGGAGSLGLVVVVEPESDEPFLAVTTAAHVLSLTQEMRDYREVASPAQADRDDPKSSDVIGQYHDGTLLVRQQAKGVARGRGNRSDLAIVRIAEDVLEKRTRVIDKLNHVPHPDDPDNPKKRIPITGIVPKERIHDYVDETIYKIGRTSGHTCGRLDLATAGNITPKMHNGAYYRYEDLGVVEFPKDKDFSQPGDSGALVYAKDGKALGFIVGVEDKSSLFCPASTLTIYNCRLYNPDKDDF